MNIPRSGLSDLTPAQLLQPWNPIKGGIAGIGIGDLTPGTLLQPWNPMVGVGALVPAATMYHDVEPNSVTAAFAAQGLSGCGGCGGMRGGGCSGCSGMGTLSLSSFTTWVENIPTKLEAGDMTTWAAVGGVGLVLAYFLFGHRSDAAGYRQARRDALAKVRAQYPTTYGRARRAVSAF